MRRALSVCLAGAALSALLACARPAPDATPEGAVHAWLERAEASVDDRRAAREAYALLGPEARRNLEERAARASLASGRRLEPHEMIAEGRFALRFRPKSVTAVVTGDDAVVRVRGSSDAEVATVRCRREGAVWRIEPGLPPLGPPVRPEGG